MKARHSPALSRRSLLGGAVLATAGLGLRSTPASAHPQGIPSGSDTIDCFGTHQAGVETPVQAFATFVALNLRPSATVADLAGLMRVWTEDIIRLTQGRPALADPQPELATVPARLTVTVGFGPSLLAKVRLSGQAPSWLRLLPDFAVDDLQAEWTGGDILLQIAADDPMTVSHCVRVMVGDATTVARPTWTQNGFHRPASTAPTGTGRNLMGQIDGTANPLPGSDDFAQVVWVSDTPPWLVGGTAVVVRRIRMDLPLWGTLSVQAKEEAIGRRLDTGAPLTGDAEFDPPDFEAVDASGLLVIPPTSHIRLAHAAAPEQRILRRPYNYDDGPDDVGLIFTAFMADPVAQFVPIQQRLAKADVLNLWTTPVGSAVFAILPGFPAGDWLGETLLG